MKDFKKYFNINATPDEVYNALTNEATIQLWSGEKANMIPEENTEFSMFDGAISGINLEFIKGKKIVQRWYFDDQEEPSIVSIILHSAKAGTSVELRHTNIPDEYYENITEGWVENYFAALAEFYE
ncbi:MAG: SRPBCC domain-containing protein [Bacteroidetes bacterium]|nr:SRPBCC domain-containing protein [Bacteroidota bacterium]